MPFSLNAQTVIIPRDGFPYCEPFTNSTTRANTVFDGVPTSAFLTGGSGDPDGDGFLRLTNNNENQRGYVFIDLPFSSAYGIKVSFEYFAYGGITATAADGISFFMFDGEIGPSDFQIGGLGGSLGYSSWRNNAGTVTQPGLKGGYIGIGFDAFRNFGNEYEGRFGGFRDASATGFGGVPDPRQYYNSIAIRGPETTNYQFIDGRRTNDLNYLYETQPAVYTDPIDANYYLWSGVASPLDFFAQRFTIGSTSRAETCSENGYRKVFIDLAPVGGGNYTVTVDMLINTGSGNRLVNIFNNVPYNFPAFTNLKMGFAASTGSPNTNFHEIRNVTAQVSDYSAIPIPEIENLDAEVCQGESNLFEFDVTLTSENSFVRCVQLFENNPGAPDNSSPVGGDPAVNNCGLSNVCIEKCDPNNNSITLPGKGTFTVELDQLTSDNFDVERFEASVRFEPVAGFVGTAEIFYQVLDNYGLLSFPKSITVISNPYPKEIQPESIEFPTCDGQSDGRIFDYVIGDLEADFDYEWFFNGTSIGKSGASNTPLTNGQSTFELNGINIGTYTLTIWNPSENGRCEESFDIVIDQEDGTPVELDVNDQIICEGQEVTFNPTIDPAFGSDLGAEFFWFLSADRSGGPITDGSTRVIDGQNVTFQIIDEKQITVLGLVANGNNFKDYRFFVEAKPTTNPGGNFCPFIGDVITEARVRVFPPIDFSASKTSDDWCLDGSGSITASVNNPSSAITFSLLDENGIEIAANTSGTFPGLVKGDYEVLASSTSPVCSSIVIPITIEGPDQPISLTAGPSVNSFCNDANGELQFDLSGGNLPYKSITINGTPISNPVISGNTYTLSGLSANTYSIVVTDDKDCQQSVEITITGDEPSVFATTNDEICEGETASVSPQTITQSTSTPTFTWYYLNAGNYTQIINGAVVGGVTFGLDGGNNLSVSGLVSQATPYIYFLEVTGDKVCPQGYIPAEIQVNSSPKPINPVLDMVSCNGGADGSIQAQLAEGNLSDFQFALSGSNGTNIGFTSNSGLFTGLASGTYDLSIRSSGGCEVIFNGISITEPPVLTVVITSKSDATCSEDNGQLDFTLSGGTPDGSGDYQITINGAAISTFGSDVTVGAGYDFTITNLAAGNYLVEVEDANGCLISASEIIQDIEEPVFAVQDVDVCEGQSAVLTPEIVSNSIGAIPVYSWAYENPSSPSQSIPIQNGDVVNGVTYSITNGNLTVDGLVYSNTPYKYFLTVSGNLVCPGPPLEAEIKVLQIPEAIFQEVNVSCFNANDGEIQLVSVNPSGSNTFTIIETGESNTSGNFSGLPSGDYTIRVQEQGSSCFEDFPVTLTQPDELLLVNSTFSNPTCGDSNGTFQFELVGTTSNFEVLVNGNPLSDYSSSTTGQTIEVTDLPPGNYSISVTNENGCQLIAADLFNLVNDAGVILNMNPLDLIICSGAPAVLNPTYSPAPPIVPTLKWFFDANITQPIVSSPVPDQNGVTYLIDSSTGQLSVQGLVIGSYTYYVEISGTGICTEIETATLEVIPEITATIVTEDIICFGDTNGTIQITPAGGNGNFEFSLNGSPFTTTSSYSNLAAGSYTVSIRNDVGCLTEIDVEILGPTGPISTNDPTIIRASCDLDNGSISDLVISGGYGNYSVEWRKGSSSGAVVPGSMTGVIDLAPDTYFLLITDGEGCSTEFPFVVGESSDPVYEIVPPINSCTGNSVSIRPVHIAPDPSLPPAAATEVLWYSGPGQTGLIQNGAHPTLPGVTYSIDDSDWLNPELVIDGLPSGTYEFYFFVVCTSQEIKIDVIVFDSPAVVFESQPISCFGDSDGKIAAISGTDPDFTYSINGANPISLTELEALTYAAGNYEIEVITPAAGCPQILDVLVEGPSGSLEMVLLSELDPSCNLENGEINLQLKGGNPSYTLTLNGVEITGFDASLDGVEVLLENLPGGTYLFELTDSQNCSPATLSITLDPLTVPEFDAVGAEICAFDPGSGQANSGVLQPVVINLAGSSPIFTWFYINASGTEVQVNDGDQLLGGTAKILPSGELELTGVTASDTPYNFLLEVTGALVCPQPKIEVDFVVNSTPEVILEKTDIACFGDLTGQISVQSGSLPGYTYTINTGESNGTGTFTSLPAGTYSIEVSNGSICTQTLQIEITQPNELLITEVEFTEPTCDDSNGEIIFNITGGTPAYEILINNLPLTIANYTFSNNADSYTIQNLAPGTYSINVTDENGCETVANNLFTLTNNPGVDIESQPIAEEICEEETSQLTPDLTIPAGVTPILRWYRDAAATQQIISSPTPDADGVVYQINAQGVLSVTNLPAGVYNYYLRISGPGICTTVTEATLTVVALPAVVLDISNISCFGANDGSVQVSSGHDSNFVYTLSSGVSNSTGEFLNLSSGDYILEVESPTGCIQVIDFEIVEPGELAINGLDFINPTCDEENGEITFEITGGTGAFSILINGQELNDSNFAFFLSGQEFTVKGLAPGTYTIQVTDENGCVETVTDLFTLVNEAGILIGSNPLLDEIMLGEVATLTPDLTVPSGSVFDLKWYFDPAATQVVTSDNDPAADGVIYLIDGNGQFTLTNLSPGTYTYYLEISGDGICATLTEGVVIVKSPLTADIVTTPVTCFGGSDGSISIENIIGGTPPLSFSLDGITWQPSTTFENLPVGTYTIFVTDPTITSGFLSSFPNIIVETSASQIVANTPDIIRSSCGLSNGAIQNLVITGGAGSFTFEWRQDDPVTGLLLTNGTLNGIEDLSPGTYYITVNDGNGCPEVFSYTITEIPGPVYEIVPPIDVCVGEVISILPLFIAPNPPEPTPPTEIEWYKEAGQVGLISNGPDSENSSIIYAIDETDWVNPRLTISNLPVGNHDFYFYVVCTGQEIKVDVNVFEIPEVVFETSPITCFEDTDGKIVLVSGDLPEYTYSLNGGSPISLSELENLNFGAGSNVIEVLTPAGCAQTVNLNIQGPSSALDLDPLITIDPGCGADNGKIQGQITGGWAPYTVNIFKEGVLLNSFVQSSSDLAIGNLSIGIYSLEIIDDEGCRIVSDDLNLVDGPTQILIENQEICEGSVVTLVATLDPPVSQFTIQWFFDEAGTQPINSSPNPASDGITYQISSDGKLTLTGLQYSAVPYQYFASAIGPEVCVGFVAKPTVQVNEIPAATTSIIPEQCFGDGGTITIDATGGNGGNQYSIDGVNFQTSNTFNVQQGTYTATVRTGDGCILEIPDLIVTGPSAPIAVESIDQVDANCGQDDGSITITFEGGFGDYEVDLYLNSTIIASGSSTANGSIIFSDIAVGSYSFEVSDSGGCTIRFDDLVAIQDLPTTIMVNDESICEGEEATLTPSVALNSPDLKFTWYFDAAGTNPISNGTSGALNYQIDSNGSLTIQGLLANGSPYEYFVFATGTDICLAEPVRAIVNVTGIPNLRVSNPSIVCDPQGTVDLTQFIEGFNPAVYDYSVLSPLGSTMRLDELTEVDLSGDYRVRSTVKGTTCWNQPQRIRVIISESLLVAEFNYLVDFGNGNIFQNEDIPLGEDVYFNDISQGSAVIWNWDFGDGFTSNEQNPVHAYNEIGSYVIKLRVVDNIGCESIYEMVVVVQDDFDVIIPNAFTPLGNKNQFFKPEHRGIASLEFFIFNTWGELIYTTTSLEDKGWDGTLNGSNAPNGNYVYRGRFVSRGGEVIEKSGVFILIR